MATLGLANCSPTKFALPQTFSYLKSRDQTESALDIIELKQLELGVKAGNDLDLQKVVIREAALAKTVASIKTANKEDIKVVRLDESNLSLSKIRNESGFKIVDTSAIKRGDGANAELVTVIYAKCADNNKRLVPLVFAHSTTDDIGWKIKGAIDDWSKEVLGGVGEDLITSKRFELLSKFVNKVLGIKKVIATGAAIVAVGLGAVNGIGYLYQKQREEDKQAEVARQLEIENYDKNSSKRIEFVKSTLESIKANSSNSNTKSWLLGQIQLQHYDTLVKVIRHGDKEARLDAANTLRELVLVEVYNTRSPAQLWRSAGPYADNTRWFEMEAFPARRAVVLDLVKDAFNGQTDSELRANLISTMDSINAAVMRSR